MMIKKIIILLTICIIIQNCTDKRVEMIYNNMTLEQKIGQMIMVAIPDSKMNKQTEEIMNKYLPGGIILFGFNFSGKDNLKNYINDLQLTSITCSGIPLFVSIDQEGGRVIRITDGVTQFPGNMVAGIAEDKKLVYSWAKITGMQLRMLGVNMNLAPVLDINNNPDNPVINTRSFGSDSKIVSEMGINYIKGLQDSRCIAVGKHFPGHGDTNKDSHLTLPVIHFDIERLKRMEFVPFIKAIDSGVECIMTAHIAFPKILQNNDPATISNLFLTDILRKEMKFKGIIITDDMEMNAISKIHNIGEAAVKSVQAGADIVLISSYGNNIPAIYNSLKDAVKNNIISEKRIHESLKRIIELKLKYQIMSYDNNKIDLGRISYTDKELGILKESLEVNAMLSRKGIYYSGNIELLQARKYAKKIFVSSSSMLKDLIKKDSNTEITFFNNVQELYNSHLKSDKKSILYLHMVEPNINSIREAKSYCKNKKIDIVLISSGNPFPIARAHIVESILFSFSNTEESIRQLAACLNGEFKPKTKINFDIGI